MPDCCTIFVVCLVLFILCGGSITITQVKKKDSEDTK